MDIIINGSGTVYQVAPVTPTGREWASENVNLDDYQDHNCFAVEHRYIEAVTFGALEAGLRTSLNGKECFAGVGDFEGSVVFHPSHQTHRG